MSIQYKGVNLSGLEFGSGNRIWVDYALPGKEHYDYWAKNVGSNIIRLPFTWERLQPQAGGALDKAYLSYLSDSVSFAKANGMTIILDMHNYARYNGQLTDAAKLSDVWNKLGDVFGGDKSVWFNLMNEPYNIPAQQWADISQKVVNDLRADGITNKILLSGTAWSGAHSWVSSGNAAAYANFKDPLNNFAFDVHQYLDADSSGFTGKAVPGAGSTRLVQVTEWAESKGFKLFLGETGAANDSLPGQEHANTEIEAMMKYMEAHSQAWIGWTLWGAGPWWGKDYCFYINPEGLGTSNVKHAHAISDMMEFMTPGAPQQEPQQPEPQQPPATQEPSDPEPTPTGGITADNKAGATTINGTSKDDIVNTLMANMDSTDNIKLGAGKDTLVIRDADFTFETGRYTGLSGIDVIDARASTGNAVIKVGAAFMNTTDNGTLQINYGSAGIQLDTSGINKQGHEVLLNGSGVVRLWGGADSVTVNAGTTGTVYGGGGNDLMIVRGGNATLEGQVGDDRMVVMEAARVTMRGGDGNDTFEFAKDLLTKDITVDGGAGNDTLIFRQSVNVDASDSSNVRGIEAIRFGGAENSFALLNGNTGQSLTVSGEGSTPVNARLDVSAITSDRTINIGENINLSISGKLAGSLVLQMNAGANGSIAGSTGNEIIIGNALNNILHGGGGNDTLTGGGGADVFVFKPGDGTDTITDFAAGSDRIDLRAFGTVKGLANLGLSQSGADTVVTISSSEKIILKNVTMAALKAQDFIFGSGGTTPTQPNPDPDPVSVIKPVPEPHGNEAGITANIYLRPTTVTGTSKNDTILAFNTQLDPGDVANLGQGYDTLKILSQRADLNTDNFKGIKGVDHIDLTSCTSPGIVKLGTTFLANSDHGEVTISHGKAGLKMLDTSALDHSKFDVFLYGEGDVLLSSGNDKVTLIGGAPGKVYGGAGDDVIYGDTGNDILYGGSGMDFLYGHDGNDILIGGPGADLLIGGAGADIFRYLDIGDAGDVIQGFEAIDRIDLNALLAANGLGSMDKALSDGYVSVTQSGAHAVVAFDTDGAAGAAKAVVLATVENFNANELQFVNTATA